MYVDDLVTGGNTLDEVNNLKRESVNLFQKGGFTLHKWNSNVPALESETTDTETELSYAKQIFSKKLFPRAFDI